MATYASLALAVPASDTSGAVLRIDDRGGKYVELSGTFVATITFQISFDPVSAAPTIWRDLRSETAPTGFFLNEPATFIRATTSGYSSGAPAALVRVSQ